MIPEIQLYKTVLTILSIITVSLPLSAQLNRNDDHLNNDKNELNTNEIILDADYKLAEALEGSTIPYSIRKDLEIVIVKYYGYDGILHQGQIIINQKVADDIKVIFNLIEDIKFPVQKVIPMVEYNWSDEQSMEDNNTSAFNYRVISGTKILSMHANGFAIDINPRQNPYVKNGKSSPPGSNYKLDTRGTLRADSEIVKAFKKLGWTWGGDWKSIKDYQHFQKRIK